MREKEKEEWGVMKEGALVNLQGSSKITFKKHVAEVIAGVSGGKLVRMKMETAKKEGLKDAHGN